MKCKVQDGDDLYRHSVHPLSYSKNKFKYEKFWRFVDCEGRIETSVAWDRYVPDSRYVHEYGCRLASKINDKKRIDGKLPAKNRHVYCGAYSVKAQAVRALAVTGGLNEVSSADVFHQVENGELAHAALVVVLRQGEFNVEGTKTAIMDRLWNASSGPLPHICDCDQDINPHPNSNLSNAPSGTYVDSRSYFSLLWDLGRFHIFCWFWRAFNRHSA